MASIIEVIVLAEDGEQVGEIHLRVEYGEDNQRVLVVLADEDVSTVPLTARQALNASMARQIAFQDGYDA